MKSYTLLFAVLLCYAQAARLPPEFQVCKRSDPAFNKCFKTAIASALPILEDGIPKLHLTALDPLIVPSATIKEGRGAFNVVQKYTDVQIHSFFKTKVTKAEGVFTPDGFELDISLLTPQYYSVGNYDFDGRILVVPIVGKGKAYMNVTNMESSAHIAAKTFEKKGKIYVAATDVKISLNPEKMVMYLTNLFNGDEQLGNEMNDLLNENWKLLTEDAKPGYEALLASLLRDYVNNIFGRIPYDELFPQ